LVDEESKEIIEAINLLEATQLDAIKATRPATPPVTPEPVTEVVYQTVDPEYHQSTKNTVALAETLQQKMEYAQAEFKI